MEPNSTNVEIVEFPATLVACLEHRGHPSGLMGTVGRFIAWRKASGESPNRTSQTFGIPYGDPATMEPSDYRHDVCGSVTQPVKENEYGVVTKTIPGGRCARLRHQGSTSALAAVVETLYRRWLPDSGEQLRDFPCFFHYVRRMPEFAEAEQLTEVYLPLT